jgi:glycosyltransferase involved in cell wall biosynthesis
LKVLYFTRDYTPHDHRFLSSMAENGLQVYSLRLERRGPQREDRALPAAVEQLSWGGGQQPFTWRDLPMRVLELRRLLRQVEPDVIHAGPVQSCAFLAALANAEPLVTMSWGSDLLVDAYRSTWMKRVTRYTLRRTDALVGDCQAVREAAADFGFPPKRVTLFPWGVDLTRFSPAGLVQADALGAATGLRQRLGWQENFVILSLRSWEPVYGVDVVVKAFAQAVRQSPNLRMILLGNGSLAGQIQGLLQREELHPYVHLGGQISQNDLPELYRAADLYVSASHSDGSSVSLMEALASGLPVLVSDIPGNREWIEPGLTPPAGELFPDGDVAELAAGLLRSANDPAGLLPRRSAARALAERRANWPENFQKLLQTYQTLKDSHIK